MSFLVLTYTIEDVLLLLNFINISHLQTSRHSEMVTEMHDN